jgi:hypothetical protein
VRKFVGDVGQEALLATEEAFQAFERLVEGAGQIADLVGATAMGHAAAQVVGAGDLSGDGGDVFQRAK